MKFIEPLRPNDPTSWPLFMRYGYPGLIILAIIAITQLSTIDFDLWVVQGHSAEVVAYAYVGTLLVGMRVQEQQIYEFGSFLALLTFGGRAGGFFSKIIDPVGEAAIERAENGWLGVDWSLTGAMLERLILALSVVAWHLAMGQRAIIIRRANEALLRMEREAEADGGR